MDETFAQQGHSRYNATLVHESLASGCMRRVHKEYELSNHPTHLGPTFFGPFSRPWVALALNASPKMQIPTGYLSDLLLISHSMHVCIESAVVAGACSVERAQVCRGTAGLNAPPSYLICAACTNKASMSNGPLASAAGTSPQLATGRWTWARQFLTRVCKVSFLVVLCGATDQIVDGRQVRKSVRDFDFCCLNI